MIQINKYLKKKKHFCFIPTSWDVYDTQDININFLSGYIHHDNQASMTKCKLYL